MIASAREYRNIILELLPQGELSEEQYLWLTDHANHLLEFTDGNIKVLPMPTDEHQGILFLLSRRFFDYLDPRGGLVRFAPLRIRPHDPG